MFRVLAALALAMALVGCRDEGGGMGDAGTDAAPDADVTDTDGDGVADDVDVCPNGTTSTGALGMGCAGGCALGYDANTEGTMCLDADECELGSDNCAAHASCTNIPGSFTCACNDGYAGDGRTCTDADECTLGTDDCADVATCTNTDGSFTCACPSDHVGDGRTCTFSPECASLGCSDDGHCEGTGAEIACVCNDGYEGDGESCTDVDECDAGQTVCGDAASCANLPGSFDCTDCEAGYEASADGRTCVDIDECVAGSIGYVACLAASGGTCTDTDGSFTCSACPSGFAISTNGRACENVDECAAGATGDVACRVAAGGACMDSIGSFVCGECPMGFMLAPDSRSCVDVDECATGNVGHTQCSVSAGGVCSDVDGSFSCTSCPAGFAVSLDMQACNDVDECAPAASGDVACRVAAGGACTNNAGGYTCTACPAGYAVVNGTSCVDIDECELGTDTCAAVAICTNTGSSYTCACPSGYVGDGHTCTPDASCAALQCDDHAHCDEVGGVGSCICNAGFTGDGLTCDDVDECAAGQTTCGASASCTNTSGTFTCTPCGAGYRASANGLACENIDECVSGGAGDVACRVSTGGTCTDNAGSYACTCGAGFIASSNGLSCDDVDECATGGAGTVACQTSVGGVCANSLGSFTCTACPSGYSGAGTNACANIDECATGGVGQTACQVVAGATCTDTAGSYTCGACPTGTVLSGAQTACVDTLPSRADMVLAMRRANEYQMSQLWNQAAGTLSTYTRGVFFAGNIALYGQYPDSGYRKYLEYWGTQANWGLQGGNTTRAADNQAIGQVYVDMYRWDTSQTNRLTNIEANMMTVTNTPMNDWATASGVFMSMPVFARFAALRESDNPTFAANAAQRAYDLFNYIGTGITRTGGTGLYNSTYHLWWQSVGDTALTTGAGLPVLSSRGSGYVLAALARVIPELEARPSTDAGQLAVYRQTYLDMAAALAPLQRMSGTGRGFWPSNLLNPAAPTERESTGTALITYALAWGINHGLLDSATYRPIVTRAWNGLVSQSLTADGRLHWALSLGQAPSGTIVNDSPLVDFEFLYGGFLLAGSELLPLAQGAIPPTISSRNLALLPGVIVAASAVDGTNVAASGIDNNPATRWAAAVGPQPSLTVTLPSSQTISAFEVMPAAARQYQFRIEVSTDNMNWTTAVDMTANSLQRGVFELPLAVPVQAQYVRLVVTGAAGTGSTFASILEFRILQ